MRSLSGKKFATFNLVNDYAVNWMRFNYLITSYNL